MPKNQSSRRHSRISNTRLISQAAKLRRKADETIETSITIRQKSRLLRSQTCRVLQSIWSNLKNNKNPRSIPEMNFGNRSNKKAAPRE
jgi:hypothetical protein